MMGEVAKVISTSANYAVVQLPGRNFPGVVFQGDSLRALYVQVEEIQRLASKQGDSELTAEVADLYMQLSDVTSHFEAVCKQEGIDLPY